MVVSSKGKQTLKTGQIIASAILFQNDVKLLWQNMDEQGANKGKIMPGATGLKMKGKRRSLITVAASRLYAQVSLPFNCGTFVTFLPGFQPFAGEVGLRSYQGVREVQQGPSSVLRRI